MAALIILRTYIHLLSIEGIIRVVAFNLEWSYLMTVSMIRTAIVSLVSAGALFAGAASAASAAPLYSNAGTAAMGSPASFSDGFSSSTAGKGSLSFDVVGTNSLDGDNFYIDVFSLTVNGAQLLSGTFNMSGGGDSKLFSSPSGTIWNTVTNTCTGCSNPNYLGGTTHIVVPIDIVAGSNTLVFGYDSPVSFGGSARDGSQGIGDESWALSNVSVTVASVPEPETYAMLLAGIGMLGMTMRRRRSGS